MQLFKVTFAVCLLFLITDSSWSQDSLQTENQKKSKPLRLVLTLSDNDRILPITSIEWGIPDRWSLTSRYVHSFGEREKKTWHHAFSIALCPGISGGRFTIGYQGIYDPPSTRDFGIFYEARLVLLRTWGNPLNVSGDQTFIGAEVRSAIMFLINAGVGYYKRVSDYYNGKEYLIGFHVGIGI